MLSVIHSLHSRISVSSNGKCYKAKATAAVRVPVFHNHPGMISYCDIFRSIGTHHLKHFAKALKTFTQGCICGMPCQTSTGISVIVSVQEVGLAYPTNSFVLSSLLAR